MDKVFTVELATDKRRYCELELPATPYELLDALEKLQMKPGEQPKWEFIENNRFHFLHVHLTDECDLYQLNALATQVTFVCQMNMEEVEAVILDKLPPWLLSGLHLQLLQCVQ